MTLFPSTLSRKTQSPSTLIATLGSEAQVVSAVLDLLTRQGETITRLALIHTDDGPDGVVWAARTRLGPVFDACAALTITEHPILDAFGKPLCDVDTESAAQAAFRCIYKAIFTAKQAGQRVHLSIAGGRKTMAVFGMAAAQLLFDEQDQLWHLFSAGDFLHSKRLHPTPQDEAHLIPVPVILWSQISPVLAGLRKIEDPYQALEHIRRLQLHEKVRLAEQFWEHQLSDAERRVVAVLVLEGAADLQIAERLFLSPRTVEQHLRKAYQKAADFWTLENTPNRGQLISLLSYFLTTRINRENPA